MSGPTGNNPYRASGVVAAVSAGREGTVDWDTSIHTSTVTAESGKGYFVNTTAGVVTVNLPAATVGDIVGIKDYAGTFQTYACTVAPNGSDNIGGGTAVDPTLAVEGESVLLVYADATQGWLTTENSVTASPTGAETFMVATGGTPCAGAISGDYKYHTFTGPGNFTVCSASPSAPNNVVSYMVVAGGGGGSGDGAGGGGAGGYREGKDPGDPYTASPLDATTTVPVSASPGIYPIAVGAGGSAVTSPPWTINGGTGSVSTFSTITSAGGGGGGNGCVTANVQSSSGGGGRGSPGLAGTGNTPPASPAQGTDGGNGRPGGSGGGGGATVAAADATGANGTAGGAGATTSINATPTARAGGGGGASGPGVNTGGAGGAGGGGRGPGPEPSSPGIAGTANTGGGGGGGQGGPHGPLGAIGFIGGSGTVIIRYKFQ